MRRVETDFHGKPGVSLPVAPDEARNWTQFPQILSNTSVYCPSGFNVSYGYG